MARPRKAKRERERQLRKQVARVERDARTLPGGAASHPIEVGSAAVVELKARGTPCVRCGGQLDLRRDQAASTPRGVLREIGLACRSCHAERTLWFRVVPPAVN
ncbi:MAG TPA: hypothetical protein VHM31_18125 [Polyangia bacterium]|nr:hypothetical protein [Polyangia bacterium]